MAEEGRDVGLLASVRRMAATLLELVRVRLELLSTEVEEQIDYAISLVLWGIAAIFFGSITLLLLALTIIIAYWDQHRLLAALLVTAAFAFAALGAALLLRSRLRNRPRFLSATTEELRRDATTL